MIKIRNEQDKGTYNDERADQITKARSDVIESDVIDGNVNYDYNSDVIVGEVSNIGAIKGEVDDNGEINSDVVDGDIIN